MQLLFDGCLNAIGIPTRGLGLKTRDVETRKLGAGHVVVEAYLRDLKKWIFIDGQFGNIIIYNGIPLNAVELGEVIRDKSKNVKDIEVISLKKQLDKFDYFKWIEEYLYFLDFTYFQKEKDGKLLAKSVMLVPLEANNPTIFQRDYKLNIDIYTHSVIDFYPDLDTD